MNEVMNAEARRVHAQPHATTRTYVMVAVVLTVLTLIEFSVVYVHALRAGLVPLLLVLSAAKFALVALFFMHLRFDRRLFSAFFGAGLALAVLVAVSLMVLLHI